MTHYKMLASDCLPDVTCPKVACRVPGMVAIVGTAVTDPDMLAELGVGPGEGAVEITEALFRAGHDSLGSAAT